MSQYRVSVRFLNGDKRTYTIGPAKSHEEARKFVSESLVGAACVIAMKLPEPLVINNEWRAA